MIWNFVSLFTMYVYQKKFKKEFSFVSFEQNMRKKMHFKSLIYKTISQRQSIIYKNEKLVRFTNFHLVHNSDGFFTICYFKI